MSSQTRWLSDREMDAWLRLLAVVELLPGALDAQLRRDSALTHFEYQALAMLSQAPKRTLQMSALADRTNATLPRLSHVITRLSDRGLVERTACPTDGRATNVVLTDAGWETVVETAPGHLATARELVIDAISPGQVEVLADTMAAVLQRLDPDGRLASPPRP